MSHSKPEDRKNKWLRLAVGATLLAGASGAVLPGMAGATETTVSDMGEYYDKLDKATKNHIQPYPIMKLYRDLINVR